MHVSEGRDLRFSSSTTPLTNFSQRAQSPTRFSATPTVAEFQQFWMFQVSVAGPLEGPP
jgi:hypothetical protein